MYGMMKLAEYLLMHWFKHIPWTDPNSWSKNKLSVRKNTINHLNCIFIVHLANIINQ